MKVRQRIDGVDLELEFRRLGSEVEFRLLRPGKADIPFRKADVLEVEPGVFSILVDGRSYDVRLEHAHYGTLAQHRSTRLLLEKAVRESTRPGASSGLVPIRSAMPGRVVRVLVVETGEVDAGQGLFVIEAMKMQNEIVAPRAGIVRRLSAKEGCVVAAGELLCQID